MKKKFEQDLEIVYNLVKTKQDEINNYFEILDIDNSNRKFIDKFISKIKLDIDKESRYAVVARLVQLREDNLVGLLNSKKKNSDEITKIKNLAYEWVKDFYIKNHQKLLDKIEEDKLLTPFYRCFLQNVHNVGVAITAWQPKWTSHIIDGINRELFDKFNGDESKVFEFLNQKNLLDVNRDGDVGDRSYSVLVKNPNNEFHSLSYNKAFSDEVILVVLKLEKFKNELSPLEDNIFNQKQEIINYIDALKNAFCENETKNLIDKWAEVDKKWMKITIPLQIGHPLEYYEDRYRKAVALEWDLRIKTPHIKNSNELKNNIKVMFNNFYSKIGKDKKTIFQAVHNNLKKTTLYLSRPMLFYGAEFNGLFSAQVVPNDENVSKLMGKKIITFGDNVLSPLKSRPKMKIDQKIFSAEFLKSGEKVLEDEILWHKIYEITTIGHEFGHILWCENDTETLMNKNGNFKNIEEFKATTGGLMAYFENPNPKLDKYILEDIIKRAVKLISWKEVEEVEPYFVEGLIHLTALFESKILEFNQDKLKINEKNFDKLKIWYGDIYQKLAIDYLDKKDANEFLNSFVIKSGKVFEPINKKVNKFVDYYYNLYLKIGRETV